MKTSIILPLALTLSTFAFAHTASACSIGSRSEVTFYSYSSNDPPGNEIAYDCGRGYIAGGTGTYADPLTMASAKGEYNQCEIVYLPYLEKYLRYEDFCAQCTYDWNSRVGHIAVWIGSIWNGGKAELNCEDDLSPCPRQFVVRQPSLSLSVNAAALFQNGKCNTGATYPRNQPPNFCSIGTSRGSFVGRLL